MVIGSLATRLSAAGAGTNRTEGDSNAAASSDASFAAAFDVALGSGASDTAATEAADDGRIAMMRMFQTSNGYVRYSANTVPLALAQSSSTSVDEAAGIDDALTPVTVIDAPIEQPNARSVPAEGRVLTRIGNASADELADRVMAEREKRGLAVNDGIRDIAVAQTGLKALGYDLGGFGPYGNGVDGILGDYTTAALKKFQQNSGIEATGTLTEETAAVLKRQAQPEMAEIDASWERELAGAQLDSTAYAGTANPYWYVRFAAGKGDNAATMDDIDAAFKGRLAALARDSGHGFVFGEGYRDYDRQAYLYDQYVNHGGNLAAKPGTSQHNFGMAVDTQSAWLQQLEDGLSTQDQQVLSAYGLAKPMASGSGVSHENWHIQPIESLSS